MKVPFSATTPKTNQKSNVPKPASNNVNNSEPKSSGNSAGFFAGSEEPSQQQWVEHLLNHSQDWDSLVRELGIQDDPNPDLKSIPQFNHYESQFSAIPEFPINHSFDSSCFVPPDFTFNRQPFDLCNDFHHTNNVLGFEFVDELIRAAECFDSNELQPGQVILARLNQQFRSPAGNSLQRAAFYFKEALQSLLTGESTRPSSSEIVQTIKAYKLFSNISPIVMFSNFTANQAILEAVDCSTIIHVIDFDIGLGGHWASFLKAISENSDSRKVVRISAVVPEGYGVESRLIRENLSQFARELKIGFEIDFVMIRTFEFLQFKSFKLVEGEKIAVLLSPAIFRQIGAGFMSDCRKILPNVVVYVDGEGMVDGGTSSFRRSVIDGIDFYSTVLESLEAATVGGGGEDWIRRIEMFVLRPKIVAAVEAVATGRRGTLPWREALSGAGMRQVGLSQFADFQADCLLRRLQFRGFHVAKRYAEMVLCWQDRPLISTSAWRW